MLNIHLSFLQTPQTFTETLTVSLGLVSLPGEKYLLGFIPVKNIGFFSVHQKRVVTDTENETNSSGSLLYTVLTFYMKF